MDNCRRFNRYVQAGTFDLRPVIETPRPTPSTSVSPQLAGTGSGWSVSSTQIVTNAHVAGECAKVEVAGRGEAKIAALDKAADLALLTVATEGRHASLRMDRVRQGEDIIVVGYPFRGMLNNGANVTTGIVSALAGPKSNTNEMQITAPVQPGNSGGPVLDRQGRVAGVVVSQLNPLVTLEKYGSLSENINFAVSLSALVGFLDAHGVEYVRSDAAVNTDTAEIVEDAKQFTVLIGCYR